VGGPGLAAVVCQICQFLVELPRGDHRLRPVRPCDSAACWTVGLVGAGRPRARQPRPSFPGDFCARWEEASQDLEIAWHRGEVPLDAADVERVERGRAGSASVRAQLAGIAADEASLGTEPALAEAALQDSAGPNAEAAGSAAVLSVTYKRCSCTFFCACRTDPAQDSAAAPGTVQGTDAIHTPSSEVEAPAQAWAERLLTGEWT
jgi:hypothetical protein